MRFAAPPDPAAAWRCYTDGVGVSQGRLLQHGDVITSVIQDIGTMTNRCVRVSDHVTL